jgi:PAS domain S-box-containing protein
MPMLSRLQGFFGDLSLRKAVALALFLGLTVSIMLSAWGYLMEQRALLLRDLRNEHARMVEVLALGMQNPLWELRPEAGRPLLEALLRDERVSAIRVSSNLVPEFLEVTLPERQQGERLHLTSPVTFGDHIIGEVAVTLDTRQLSVRIAQQWAQVLTTCLLQLAAGTLIIFPLLRFKVLLPLRRLVAHSETLAAGALDQTLDWRRGDELGVLGRSFEKMRQALNGLVVDLEQRNLTLREREQELLDQASILQAILDNMMDGVNLVDEQLRLVAWNRRFLDIMELPDDVVRPGVTVEELIQFNLQRGVYEASRPEALHRAILESFRTADTRPLRLTLRNGRRVDVRRRAVPGGGVVSTFIDVTEEHEARRQADANRSLLEAVMDAVPALLHVKDRQLRYQFVNRQFLTWIGLERGAVLGRTGCEVHPDGSQARDQEVLETGKALPFYEQTYGNAETDKASVWTTKVPLLDADRQVTHIITVGLDISERKQAERELARHREALHQSEKLSALGSLLSGVAHELNNPLAVVVGRSILMEEQLRDSAAAKGIAKIRGAAERCARIVKTFLTVARQQEPARVPVQIRDVLATALEMVGHRLREGDIAVTLDIEPDLPELAADPDQLSQVFMHLFVNAQQALGKVAGPRRLGIVARRDRTAEELSIRIADNGPGIPADILPRIFEPFFTTKAVGEGGGVGLSVSRGIIEAHGGTLNAAAADSGAVFEIRLPWTGHPTVVCESQEHGAQNAAPQHILIVDDVVEIAQMLGEILTEAGYRIELAEDGQAALNKLCERSFDLILSDLRMARLDGPALYAELQTRNPELLERLIFITGDTLSQTVSGFLARVQRPVIAKPFAPAEVKRVVEQTLAQVCH